MLQRAHPSGQVGPLVDRAVADSTAQHHAEDHLEDLGHKTKDL